MTGDLIQLVRGPESSSQSYCTGGQPEPVTRTIRRNHAAPPKTVIQNEHSML